MSAGKDEVYVKGDAVYVFYRMSKRCQPDRKYLATLDSRHGAYRPRMGMSDGWVAARVVADYDPTVRDGEVRIEYDWPNFYTNRGNLAKNDSGWAEYYELADIKKVATAARPLPMVPALSQPELAIITFRWGGKNEVVAPAQWGETGSSVSDVFVDSIVEMGVMPRVGRDYEVWTVYVEGMSDLVKVADSAHLIFGPSHPARRAKRTCAMYFLYPTAFEEGCIPTQETGEDGGAALIDQKSVFQTIKSMERAGIPTKFPHPSGFYEVLTSKRWTSMMCLTPHLRVPATVALPRMLVERGCATAAEKGLAALNLVKKQQMLMNGEEAPAGGVEKGVAKLGFSWEALDVKFWDKNNPTDLSWALTNLTQSIEINEELTGQPHDLETIIVQEYCPHDFELRLYVVEGRVETTVYTKFCKIKDNQEFGDFHELFEAEEAANEWMDGDIATLQDGDRQCREITNHWLAWVQSQICEYPPAIRFDYFVGRSGVAGKATVWTLEICELGFSMLGAKELPAKVFPAMMRSCLEEPPLGSPEGTTAAVRPVAAAAVPATSNAVVPQEAPTPVAPVTSQENGAAKAQQADTSQGAAVLYIVVPHSQYGTADQQKCSGKYELEKGSKANGCPVWKHESALRWLFKGVDSDWYVGDDEEKDMNFKASQGYIKHEDCGARPYDLDTAWSRGPVHGDEWTMDEGIIVTTDEAAASAAADAKGKGGGGGGGGGGGKSGGKNKRKGKK